MNENTEQLHQPAQQSATQLSIKNDRLNAVYEQYLQLTTALTNDDAAKASIASNAIEAGANCLSGGSSIAASAAKITTASNLEAQRTAYAKLSRDMIALVKNAGVSNGELYVAFCRMAMHDKGAYWISPDKEIRNPYMGQQMLTCGQVEETIK